MSGGIAHARSIDQEKTSLESDIDRVPAGRSVDDLQLFRQRAEVAEPVVGDHDQVLDPHPELARQVDAGLDRDDFARGEDVVGALREPRRPRGPRARPRGRARGRSARRGRPRRSACGRRRRPASPVTPARIASSAACWALADDLVDGRAPPRRARRWRRCGCRRSSSRRAGPPCRRRPARRGRSPARRARRAAGRRWGRRRRSPGRTGRRRARGSALRRRGRPRARGGRQGPAPGSRSRPRRPASRPRRSPPAPRRP